MTRRIEIDPECCMGSGHCQFWAPGVFEVGDDGVAHVVDPEAGSEERIRGAVEGCPTAAIRLDTD